MATAMLPNIGMEQDVYACGKIWKIGRLDIEVMEKFYQWALPQFVNPYQDLALILDKLPPDLAREEVKDAKERRKEIKDWGSPEIQGLMKTQRGGCQLFMYLLQICQPETTLSEAFAVAAELGEDRVNDIFSLARGNSGNGKAPAVNQPTGGITDPALVALTGNGFVGG